MKYLGAYYLAVLGGDVHPTKEKIKSILESIGCDVDEAKISALLSGFGDQSLDEVKKKGERRKEKVN
jgi:large subunit ribosomal protein LP2